jgi:hypothetical protein
MGNDLAVQADAFNAGSTVAADRPYAHQGLLNAVITNPQATQDSLAALTGLTRAKVAKILASDEFTSRLSVAIGDKIADGTVPESVQGKLSALMGRALDVLFTKFERDADDVNESFALNTLTACTKALGIGGNGAAPAGVTVSMSLHLEELGENLVRLLDRKRIGARSAASEATQNTDAISDGEFSHVENQTRQ